MTRDEQEMALWAAEYAASKSTFAADRAAAADLAAAFFAHRYPPQPAAPAPVVWYDEPPFPKDGSHHACWVTGEPHVQSVYWFTSGGWRYCQPFVKGPYPLHNRRVSPITKPQEPPQ